MDTRTSPLDIGSCARATGVPAKTIRYYESIGLLAPPKRALNGYRRYGGSEIEMLRFVRRARELGFSIGEVSQLLALWRDKNRASADVKALALGHARALDRRIAELKAMRRAILALAQRCHGDQRPDCPILEDIASGAARKSCRPDRGASLNNARGDSPARPKQRK